MSNPELQQVVVAYDYSDSASAAINRGIELACRSRYVLHFIVVIDPSSGVAAMPPEGKVDYLYAERVQEHLSTQLRAFFEQRDASTEVHFFVHARIGQAADEILELAREVGANLLIVGSHGRTGIRRLILGSVAERVVREAECPVLVERLSSYPHVDLTAVIKVPHRPSTYVPPLRFSYQKTVLTRPNDWPLN